MKRDLKIALLLYLVCTGTYALTAWNRLSRPSSDTHFIWLADSWLHRRLDLGRSPPHSNDWAEVEHLTLRDGTRVRGAFQRQASGRFRTLGGQYRQIADSDIVSRERRYYVSFPPMPALLLLPLVAIFGFRTNDVLFNVMLAGMVPALAFLLLRRLPLMLRPPPRRPGSLPEAETAAPDPEATARAIAEPAAPESEAASAAAAAPAADTPAERQRLHRDLWLTGLLAFGSVFYFASVIGQVWYTAHVVSLVLAALFLLCALPLSHPVLAGLCLGALMLTRPQMVFFGVVLLFEAARSGRDDGRYPLWPPLQVQRLGPPVRLLLQAGIPFLVLAFLGFAYNYIRFGHPLEFGHFYLTTMQADNIQRYGLFNYQYLPRNLACAFTLLPKLLAKPPYLQISYHGLSLLLTTPVLAYLLWPEPADPARRDLRRVLWLSALPIAVFGFLYQNDGYIQFGFRFSLDYMLLLLLLLSTGNAGAVGTWRFRALVLVGVVVNLFGAITFGRMWQFYFNGFFPVS